MVAGALVVVVPDDAVTANVALFAFQWYSCPHPVLNTPTRTECVFNASFAGTVHNVVKVRAVPALNDWASQTFWKIFVPFALWISRSTSALRLVDAVTVAVTEMLWPRPTLTGSVVALVVKPPDCDVAASAGSSTDSATVVARPAASTATSRTSGQRRAFRRVFSDASGIGAIPSVVMRS